MIAKDLAINRLNEFRDQLSKISDEHDAAARNLTKRIEKIKKEEIGESSDPDDYKEEPIGNFTEKWQKNVIVAIDYMFEGKSSAEEYIERVNSLNFGIIPNMEKPVGYIAANKLIDDMIDEINIYWPSDITLSIPPEISDSIQSITSDYPDDTKLAFIVMQFGQTKAHDKIVTSIREVLKKYSIIALRADDKQYHDDLFYNVLTYVYRCNLAIGVFERIETDSFNPNVALEVGYLLSIDKPTCLLKDRTLDALPADLVGKLYREFDSQEPLPDIDRELTKWLSDKNIIASN